MKKTSVHFDVEGFLKTLTGRPGVYRMQDAKGEVLYVGKARNLKKRVTSYFRASNDSKTQAMVAQIRAIEVTVTHTETEALILENTLIKELQPRYNVLLRDDKSYPFIYLSSTDDFPRLALHRGAKRAKGRYFGPYPSAGAARESLHLLQKVFPVRQCEDVFFKNRSRPCLQYQIKRCTAPCVGLVDKEIYQQDVQHAVMFLEGKSHLLTDDLAARMESAAAQLDFERAAHYRDQIAMLRRVQEHQYVSGERGDLDVIACAVRSGVACVQVFYVRAGRNLGNKSFFPRVPAGAGAAEVLSAFISQYYLADPARDGEPANVKEIPSEILINLPLDEQGLLQQGLAAQAGHKVTITHAVRGERARWVQMAVANAGHALAFELSNKGTIRQRLEELKAALDLDATPQRLECFDISHTMGEATVASCVVFDCNGPLKSDYRRFNIQDITPGDDYAALRQALSRRYTRLKQGEGKLPDVLLIDGGKGQVAQAEQVLEELQVTGVTLVGVAKGPGRRAGLESLFLSATGAPVILPENSPALHLIQQIRDEAHRFAITGHRQRRAKARTTSTLEAIPGMGPRRRQVLLSHFGGLHEVARAGVEDLAQVQGISREIAQRIYDSFHSD
ncbi:MAG TPA: excinuclease ABC subunit UvrC [Gammaproteobacteria bacterium]|nr:excinuclease ABC subunit UvrC [Gammaproteobacteria bacterium]